MNNPLRYLLVGLACSACLLPAGAGAGQFKRITVDGSFIDWAGVEPAVVDPLDSPGQFDYQQIFLANDENYLYVRVKLHAKADYGSFHHHIIIDADADSTTGHRRLGVGSEMMIEDGAGYQQKNGGFNEGGAAGLDFAMAPTGQLMEYEARISRKVHDAEGKPVFFNNNIVLAFEILDKNWAAKDVAPDSGGIAYEFAPALPPKLPGTQTLLTLSDTSWRYHDSGTDLGIDWLAADYDDTQTGWKSGAGLFGFGVAAGTYPAAFKTALAGGRSAYYLRVPFTWYNDPAGIALVMDTYLSDGAAFYLNGMEVKRLRLPAGAIAYGTAATGGPAVPGRTETLMLPSAALVAGTNFLQVEVHQASATQADLAFGLKLIATDSLPPAIEDPTQPADRTVVEGSSTTYSVGNILGSTPLFYQWYKDGTAIGQATNSTLTIASVLASDAGLYQVEISNATGVNALSRSARLNTTAVAVSLANPAEPVDRTITEGESTTFTVAVAGSPTLFFQWHKNDAPIPGANSADYVIASTALDDAGDYSVTISNRLNEVTSRKAHLAVQRDLIPPAALEVTGSATKVLVRFSEPVEPASASSTANYSLGGSVQVLNATLDASDPRIVNLTTSPLGFGTVYTLAIRGVKDRFNNAASTTARFRATIAIDGSFDDWAGIAPAVSEPQNNVDGKEFKDIFVANDDDFLYVRFSFHAEIGQLPVDAYFHIFFDTDNDPSTGFPTVGIGSEMMIENGGGYQQKNGQFNEGLVRDLAFTLAPETKASEFECRISRKAAYDNDGLPVFKGNAVGLVLQLIGSNWSLVDTAPQDGGLVFNLLQLPPLNPPSLQVAWAGGKVVITWNGAGTLEENSSLAGGNWTAVNNASSPYSAGPSGQQRFFRLKAGQ